MKLAVETDPKIVVIVGNTQDKSTADHGTASSNGTALPYQHCSAQDSRSAITTECAQALRHMRAFRLKSFALLAAEDPSVGSDQAVLAALHEASGVWLTGNNPMEFVHAFRDTPAGQEFTALLERGGVIGADAGAANVVGSLVLSEDEAKDPDGDIQGLSLLGNVVIDREIAKQAPSGRLSSVVTLHPGVIGISLGDGGTVVVNAGVLRVATADPILISDGQDHHGRTYYRLSPEEHLSLETHAAEYIPQTGREKFDQTLGLLFRPATALSLGAAAGIAQANNAPKEWGQGMEGYGHRFGIFAGLLATRQSLLFTTSRLDHEDLRRLRSQKSGFWPRTGDAIKFAFEARRDNGSVGFAYARFVSDLGTGILARQLYPNKPAAGSLSSNQQRGSVLQFGLGTVAADVLGNIFFEFSPDIRAKLHLDRLSRALHLPERNALR
jgi:cyanophycinase-like exopeptidase